MSGALWVAAAILIGLWLLRSVFRIVHWAIHLLLILAVIAIVVGFLHR
jgi:hypothetical protein